MRFTTEHRDEILRKSHNRTTAEYVDLVWLERCTEKPPKKRARSKSWPVSCYDKAQHGYILETYKPSNVTPIRKGRKT